MAGCRRAAGAENGGGDGRAFALLSACTSGSGGADDEQVADIDDVEVTGAVTGEVTVLERPEVVVPAAAMEGVTAITPMFAVRTDGEVDGEVEIAVPLPQAINDGDLVFAVTSESVDGPWELLPAEVVDGRIVVRAIGRQM